MDFAAAATAGSLGLLWSLVIAILDLHHDADMHLPSTAFRSETPAPPRSPISSVNSLELDIPADVSIKRKTDTEEDEDGQTS